MDSLKISRLTMSIKYSIHKASDGLPLALFDVETGVRVATFNQQLATRQDHADNIVGLLARNAALEQALKEAQRRFEEIARGNNNRNELQLMAGNGRRAIISTLTAQSTAQAGTKEGT